MRILSALCLEGCGDLLRKCHISEKSSGLLGPLLSSVAPQFKEVLKQPHCVQNEMSPIVGLLLNTLRSIFFHLRRLFGTIEINYYPVA